jgi:hypothetical protein
MGGGLMQLVAYGAQDIYLTGNPQITFWKVVYRRHTNFARESIEQTISGSSTLNNGNRGTVTISRNGDLLSGVHVVSTGALAGQGDNAIVDVEVQIGGQKIDKHTKEWMQLWAELTTPDSKADAYRAMTGVSGTQGSSGTGVYATHIPLQFWFCRNPGLALPLIALQYHEVKVVFNWGTAGDGNQTAKVYCDYVYLDTDERRRFAQVSHEYLIEQLQYQTEGTSKASYKLTLNHPVKALYWTDADVLTTETMKLRLNGHDRFAAREKEYFRLQQPMCCHTAVPRQNLPVVQTPELLATPLEVAYTAAGDNIVAGAYAADGHGSVALTAGKVGSVDGENNKLGIFNDSVVAGTTPSESNKIVKVGDLVEITFVDSSLMEGAAVAINGGVTSTVARVTSIAYTAVDEEYLTFDRDITPANPAAADSCRIVIIARQRNALCRTSSMTRKINMYSFALEPEEHQPSGTCNFSRIDTATLELSAAQQVEAIYALNYNVLRIMSGMGGLAYSN